MGAPVGAGTHLAKLASDTTEDLITNHDAGGAAPFAGKPRLYVDLPVTGGAAGRTRGRQPIAKGTRQAANARHTRGIHVGAHICLNERAVVARSQG